MDAIQTPHEIDHARRRFLGTAAMSALAGATGLLPSPLSGATAAEAIRPFRVNIPEEQIADLRRRIGDTRWPERETVNDDSQGVQLAKFQELIRYWGTGYDCANARRN